MIKLEKSWGDENFVDVENVMVFNLEKIIADYDEKFFNSLRKREYSLCEDVLSDFCFEIIDMSDEEQVFIAKVFFTSIVTEIVRVQNRKQLYHPRLLTNALNIISYIEKWTNLSEYLLSISWFVEQLKEKIIANQLLFEGCTHVENALKLISYNLRGDILTVKWLADQLNISTTHLSNVFKLQMGETVSSYITKRKLDEIIFELTYTSKSLKQIREKYGFINHSHFIQHFKRYKGITPLKYKQALHE